MSIVSGKIWPPFEAFYIQSMLFNCNSAMRSLGRVYEIFENIPENPTEEDISNLPVHVILNELQNIVINGASLSRYFWPVRNGHEERAHHLRSSLGVKDGSALQNRNLRNAIEHFDERLDRYLSSGITGYIFPEFVGARPVSEGVPGHFFRAYFFDVGIFRLIDEEYEMVPIAIEIQRIAIELEEADKNGSRLKRA